MTLSLSFGKTIKSKVFTPINDLNDVSNITAFLRENTHSLNITRAEYNSDSYTKSERDEIKSATPCYCPATFKNDKRLVNDVKARNLFVADLDSAPENWREIFADKLKGHTYIVHSSISHWTDGGKYKIRLIIPIAQAIETSTQYKAIAKHIMKLIGGDTPEKWFDVPVTSNYVMASFLPVKFSDDADIGTDFFIKGFNKTGQFFDVTTILTKIKRQEANRKATEHTVINTDVEDEFLTWLIKNDKVVGEASEDGSIPILCSRRHEHSNPKSTSGCFYYPLGKGDKPGYRTGGCKHSHDLSIDDIITDYSMLEDAPLVDRKGPDEMFDNRPAHLIANEIKTNLVNFMARVAYDKDIIYFRLDIDKIQNMLDTIYVDENSSERFVIIREHGLNVTLRAKFVPKLKSLFGTHYSNEEEISLYEHINTLDMAVADIKKLKRDVTDIFYSPIDAYIHDNHQVSSMRYITDMMADKNQFVAAGMSNNKHFGTAHFIFKHQPFYVGEYDIDLVSDWLNHFPEYEEFLEWLVACRFAEDRKTGYLWLHCDSDWGKGFIIGILEALKLSVNLSVKEVEKIIEGQPVPFTPSQFTSAFALIFDEFKSVKSELKSLQNEIDLNPKNKVRAKVDIYAKLFFSAENVPSLINSQNTVEQQFLNRMSYIKKEGTLTSRPVYRNNQGKYFNAVLNYTASKLNSLIELYRAEIVTAEQTMSNFKKRHGMDAQFNSLESGLVGIATQFYNDCKEYCDGMSLEINNEKEYVFNGNVFKNSDGRIVVRTLSKLIAGWIKINCDEGEAGQYLYKKHQIVKLIKVDAKSQRDEEGGVFKASVIEKPAL